MTINWYYAHNFGELPAGQAEIVEALVNIAEQLDKLNEKLSRIYYREISDNKRQKPLRRRE